MKKGFTLVELLVVIAIIGILAGIVLELAEREEQGQARFVPFQRGERQSGGDDLRG